MPQKQISIQLEKIRHSLAHIMAAAVQNLYGKEVQLGIGPVIENGFYYDFDFKINSKFKIQNSKLQFKIQNLSDSDLPTIEKEMQRLIGQNLDFKRERLSIADAKKMFKGQRYKLELIKDIEKHGTTKEARIKKQEKKDNFPILPVACLTARQGRQVSQFPNFPISIYQTGNFIDLCQGPHIKNTQELKSVGFKLTKIAGAYWRGDEKNSMLTRIYGVAFASKKELADYLHQQAEAEKRNHRQLGKELDLFSFHEEAAGMAFWHYKGLIIKEELIKFWRKEHRQAGYIEISTPIILNESLWQTSGHMKNYKENMYFTEIDQQRFAIKPMNCPGGLLVYKEKPHSYRELPIRAAELGLVHRQEMAGVLSGLFRVRSFTQDDAHIYCTKEQINQELKKVIQLTQRIYKTFGFDYHLELSTRPKKFIGDIKIWNKAEATLKNTLKELGLNFKINPGDGAFYGPKIDSHIKDSLGRTWQCGTVQIDFAQPENFKLEYIDQSGKIKRPVMLHRTIYGSLERFIGILIEHFAGAFPLWLAPVQLVIIPVNEKHIKSALKLVETMQCIVSTAIRIKIDDSNETVGYKIRAAAQQKIPYTIVIGNKETSQNGIWSNQTKLTIRQFGKKDMLVLNLVEFLKKIKKQIENRNL